MAVFKTQTGRVLNFNKQNTQNKPIQQTTPQVAQPYTPWTSIDNRPVTTTSGNPYIAYSQRNKPTVATPSQPVISKTMNNSLAYDPNDPEDYLMKLQARSVTGKTPTEQEYYQALQAQKALQSRQTNSANPLQAQMVDLIRQQQEQRGLEVGRDTNELDAYRKQLDQQYGVQRDELLASGERQRTAAQNVYSFSWFGRSSAAANKMADIQQWVDWSIASLNAAKEAAIAAKKAELEWADSETLSALNSRVQQYQDAANKRQMDSLQKTAEANQTSGASYIESLNNLMTTASKNGMDIWNPEDIQIYAQMARNPDGSINEEFVGALPEWMQAIIRTANIQQSKEAPKIENFGTTKNPRYMQRDGAKRVSVSWAGGWAMWWGGWVRSGGWMWGVWVGGWVVSSTWDAYNLQSELLSAIGKIRDAADSSAIRWVNLYDPDIENLKAFVKSNMTLDTFQQLKKQWVKMWSMTDSEWKLLGDTVWDVNWSMSKAAIKNALNNVEWRLTWIKVKAPTTPAPSAATQQKPKSTTRWWYKAR